MPRTIAYGHEHRAEQAGVLSGIVSGNTANANAYTDKAVTFPQAFAEVPVVVACFATDSTAAGMGSFSVSVAARSTTGFTLRFYNNTGTSRTPPVAWIAVGKLA